jgi:hypothetical protein
MPAACLFWFAAFGSHPSRYQWSLPSRQRAYQSPRLSGQTRRLDRRRCSCRDHTSSRPAPGSRNTALRPVKQITGQVCSEVPRQRSAPRKNTPIVELVAMPERVHGFVVAHPQYGIQSPVKTINGRSSLLLRGEFASVLVSAPYAVDQLVPRRHPRRPNIGGRQTPCREPARHVGHAPISPRLKPGVSGVHFDEPAERHWRPPAPRIVRRG